MSENLRDIPGLFKKAEEMHPDYQGRTILHLYQRAVSQITKASGQEIKDLPLEIILGESEEKYIEDLSWEVFGSKMTHGFGPIRSFLQSSEVPWDKMRGGESNPEFLLFAITFKEGVQPILESEAFSKEYKITREAFFDLMDGLINAFRSSDRELFAFHAGEVFKAKDFYMSGKTLGLSNAATLGLRNFIRQNPF